MSPSLVDSLGLLLPQVPVELVPETERQHLLRCASSLAPVHYCGFEVRLGNSSEVDLQQGIEACDHEFALLRRHLESRRVRGTAWKGLERLLATYARPDTSLHGGVTDLWLEFDRPPKAALSIFVGFTKIPEPAGDRLRLARAAVTELAADAMIARFDGALRRCVEACPKGTYLSHVGLMLGRRTPFIRLQVMRPEPEQVREYLEAVGWRHDSGPVVELAQAMRERAHGLAVCLDVGEDVGPRVGLEALFDDQPPNEPRWSHLLDELVGRAVCTPAKRAALLRWPGFTFPYDVDGDWPADLVLSSLRRPADHFTSFERRLGHIKIVYRPGGALEAKAYFGYEHKWLRPRVDRDEKPRPARRPRSRRIERPRRPDMSCTIAAAAEFLLNCRTPAGLWRDFSGTLSASEEWTAMASWSDEWVSAYVGCALAPIGDREALQAARHVFSILARRRMPVGGWGYSRTIAVDGDSTAWGLRLAHSVDMSDSASARAAYRALEDHRLPDGGIATYTEMNCPRPGAPSQTPPNRSYAGWCATSHACVTATAAGLGDRRACDWLRAAQRKDGSWASHWWTDDEYATALAAEALAATGRAADRVCVEAAATWGLQRIGADGSVNRSAFATALALRTLQIRRDVPMVSERMKAAIGWLTRHQEADGGWPASARMISPRPDLTSRNGTQTPGMSTLDEARTYTTATVLTALAKCAG